MSFGGSVPTVPPPQEPPPPPPPPAPPAAPTAEAPGVESAVQQAKRRATGGGRGQTVYTSPLGIVTPVQPVKRTLLGS